jgi:hypothetical protein
MKTISQKISVLVFVNLVMLSFALAEKVPEKEPPEAIQETVELTVPPEPPVIGLRRVIDSRRRERSARGSRRTGLEGWLYEPLTSPRQELQVRIAQFVAAETTLVVPTTETIEKIPDFIETTVKDLNIMCRIFSKELELSDRFPELHEMVIFSDSYEDYFDHRGFMGQESRKTKGIYLDGYGALFLIEVDFPLSAPPQAEEQEKEIEEPGDPVWRQTEQELYAPEKLKKNEKESDPAKEYDAEKVENLKRKLVKSLKYTANIRSIKADESIIISIRGRHLAANPTKVLIIRVKKSDLDSFAKGDVDFDKFRQKVQMLMY